MRDAVIVDAVRTPVGRRNGPYNDVHPADPSAHTLNSLVERTGIDPVVVDDVVWGVVSQVGEQALNVGRNAVLGAGWPESVPGTTVDRQCGSSQQAVHFAAAGVLSGQYDVAAAGGVEVMSRVPMGSSLGKDAGFPFGPRMLARYEGQQINQGLGAEMIAEKWHLPRAQLDEFALAAQEKAAAAIDAGSFTGQYAAVPGTGLEVDEG